MGGEITVWWGPDDMVSALGFGTEENMAAVRAMKSSLASWHDATPVCLIDRKRLGALAAEQLKQQYGHLNDTLRLRVRNRNPYPIYLLCQR